MTTDNILSTMTFDDKLAAAMELTVDLDHLKALAGLFDLPTTFQPERPKRGKGVAPVPFVHKTEGLAAQVMGYLETRLSEFGRIEDARERKIAELERDLPEKIRRAKDEIERSMRQIKAKLASAADALGTSPDEFDKVLEFPGAIPFGKFVNFIHMMGVKLLFDEAVTKIAELKTNLAAAITNLEAAETAVREQHERDIASARAAAEAKKADAEKFLNKLLGIYGFTAEAPKGGVDHPA